MSLIKDYLHQKSNMDQLEMLSQREQLMEDIDSIVDETFMEMFGEKNTLWDHLDRMNDTPMAEEIYGG